MIWGFPSLGNSSLDLAGFDFRGLASKSEALHFEAVYPNLTSKGSPKLSADILWRVAKASVDDLMISKPERGKGKQGDFPSEPNHNEKPRFPQTQPGPTQFSHVLSGRLFKRPPKLVAFWHSSCARTTATVT